MRWFNAATALFPVLAVSAGALLLMVHEAVLGARPEPDGGDVDAIVRVRLRSAIRNAFAVGTLAAAGAGSLVLWLLARRAEALDPERLASIVERTAGLGGDRFALLVFATLAIGGSVVLLQAGGYLRELGIDRGEFAILVLLGVLGGMFLSAARDMLMIFIGLETLSLGTYALVAFQRASVRSAEAALKYFLLGSFAAAIMLFGMALLYGVTGSLSLADVGAALAVGTAGSVEPVAAIGMVMVAAGLLFKVSAAPFHMWTPDAYEGASTPATAFMSVVVKTAAFAVLARVLLVAFPHGSALSSPPAGWAAILTGVAILTMFVGSLAGLAQENVRRLLAYSSIAHAGYALVAVIVAGAIRSPVSSEVAHVQVEAISGLLYYLLAYTAANAGALAVVSMCARGNREATTVSDLAGLATRSPLMALGFAVCVLSLTGIPPTAGFFGKFYVFRAAVQADMVPLAVIGVLTSVVAAYYYLRLLVAIYMREAEPEEAATPVPSAAGTLAVVASSLLVLAAGLFPSRYLSVAAQSVADMLGL